MSEWKTCSVLVRGTLHIKDEKPCQDRVCVFENDNVIVAVLSDGLGSLDYSEDAAEIATTCLAERFLELESTAVLKTQLEVLRDDIIGSVREKIYNHAQSNQIPIKQMDCTLLFVYIGKNEQTAIVGHLGDGAICLFQDNDAFLFNKPDKDTANGTKAIFSPDAIEHFRIGKFDLSSNGIVGFILTSDGLEYEAYLPIGSVKKKAAEYFNAVSTNVDTAETIITEKIKEVTLKPDSQLDDDISVAVLSKIEYKISLPDEITWLCPCGHRNELQETRCTHCNRDFVKIYRARIDDIKKNGKLATFEWLNMHPEKEREFIGLDPAVTNTGHKKAKEELAQKNVHFVNNICAIENMSEKSQELNKEVEMEAVTPPKNQANTQNKNAADVYKNSVNKSTKMGINILACFCCFVVGAVIMAVLNIAVLDKSFVLKYDFGGIESDIAEMKDSIANIESLLISATVETPESPASAENKIDIDTPTLLSNDLYVVSFADGLYVGTIINYLPDGRGIFLTEDEIQIGNFIVGKRNGSFVVVDSNGISKNIIYDDDTLVTSNVSNEDTKNEENP